jgi:hypothetical protein
MGLFDLLDLCDDLRELNKEAEAKAKKQRR